MKEEIITLPIGFRFVAALVVVEVKKSGLSCEGCFFFNEGCCMKNYHIACSASLRTDGNEVHFVKVGEVVP